MLDRPTTNAYALRIIILFSVSLAQGAQGTQGDTVKELMPNGVSAEVLKLTRHRRLKPFQRLERAQKHATGKRAQQIAFLLATLGSSYGKNRDYLVHAIKGCKVAKDTNVCDEETGMFLEALYKTGPPRIVVAPCGCLGNQRGGVGRAA